MQVKTETAVGLFILASLGVLIYMSFQIGSLRFATNNYVKYCLYSHDISGLNKKADVRIAGVKVGWIEQVVFEEEEQRVRMCIMILKKYHLYTDASGAIRQNGILGGKYLEIIPGDARLEKLPPHATLQEPVQDALSIDTLMKKISGIAGNIEAVSASLRDALGGPEGTDTLRRILGGLVTVTDKVSACAESLDQLMKSNNQGVHDVLTNVNIVMEEIVDTLPELREKMSKFSDAIDRDFNRIATQVETLVPPLTDVLASYQKNKGFVIKHKFRLF